MVRKTSLILLFHLIMANCVPIRLEVEENKLLIHSFNSSVNLSIDEVGGIRKKKTRTEKH